MRTIFCNLVYDICLNICYLGVYRKISYQIYFYNLQKIVIMT